MDPLTAGITMSAMGGGAGGAGGAALMSNPITAAIALAALGTAYGTSPSVRKYTNKMAKGGYEAITNPFQHLGDGSSKDSLFGGPLRGGNLPGFSGSLLGNAGLDQGGLLGGITKAGQPSGIAPGEWDFLNGGIGQNGFLSNLLNKAKGPDQKQQQQQQQPQNFGGNSQPLPAIPGGEVSLGNYLQNPSVQMANTGFYPNLMSRRMY